MALPADGPSHAGGVARAGAFRIATPLCFLELMPMANAVLFAYNTLLR